MSFTPPPPSPETREFYRLLLMPEPLLWASDLCMNPGKTCCTHMIKGPKREVWIRFSDPVWSRHVTWSTASMSRKQLTGIQYLYPAAFGALRRAEYMHITLASGLGRAVWLSARLCEILPCLATFPRHFHHRCTMTIEEIALHLHTRKLLRCSNPATTMPHGRNGTPGAASSELWI